MTLLREITGRRVFIVLTAALAVACSSDKKTLVEVQVSLGAGVAPPSDVSVTVTPVDSAPLGPWTFRWSQAQNGDAVCRGFSPRQRGRRGHDCGNGRGPGCHGDGNGFSGCDDSGRADQWPVHVDLADPSSGSDAGVPDTGADAVEDLNNPDVAPIAPDGGSAGPSGG